MKISSQEKKLLIVAGFLILAFVFYFQVLLPSKNGFDTVASENKDVQIQLELLNARLSEEKKFDESISKSQALIDEYSKNFYDLTLQEEFIRKIYDMSERSNISFKSTTYAQINSVYKDSRGGLEIKSYLTQNDIDTDVEEEANKDTSEAATAKNSKNTAKDDKVAKEKADAEFAKFIDSLNVTTASFEFSGTYSQIWEFVKLMNLNNSSDNRYAVANTFMLKEQSKFIGIEKPIYYEYMGFSKDLDSTKVYDASITIYFYMTNNSSYYLDR